MKFLNFIFVPLSEGNNVFSNLFKPFFNNQGKTVFITGRTSRICKAAIKFTCSFFSVTITDDDNGSDSRAQNNRFDVYNSTTSKRGIFKSLTSLLLSGTCKFNGGRANA